MRGLLALLSIVVLIAVATPARAAEPAPGKTAMVTCKDDPKQSYSCYLPKAYTQEKTWPILYCFAPNARGDSFVQRYRNVCEEMGWIVVGSMNSKNGPWGPIQDAIRAMWADAEVRFSLSKTMRYVSGFSGGARVSFAVADMHADNVAGVIAIGAGLPSGGAMPREGLAVYLTCGTGDPNKRELDPLFERLKKAGNPVRYENFDGGHVMPPTNILEEAVRWMDEQAVERKVQRFTTAVAAATALHAEGKLREAWVVLTNALEKNPDVKEGRKDAEKLLKSLERDPAVKPEVKARKEYERAFAWLEKNRERVAEYESPRSQARKKFERITTRWPDTRAAEEARARLEELAALGDD